MKVQLQGQALRLRIDEAELARLLDGKALRNETRWPDGQTRWQQLALADRPGWRWEEPGWCLWLAEREVRELAARLPSRDGLLLELPTPDGTALEVRFDVDVRDSTRQRLPKRPTEGGSP
jgi:hypothetical protein